MSGSISGSLASRPGVVDADFAADIAAAFPLDGAAPDKKVRFALMSRLHGHYTAYLAGAGDFAQVPRLNGDPEITAIEDAWQRWEDARVDPSLLPQDAAGFADWFVALRDRHVQPEYCRYLAEEATLDEIALFFLAEELVDSRFDDLVAMAQIGAAGVTKLTMAENYWDEMGEGKLENMHTLLFEHSAQYMRKQLAAKAIDTSELEGMEVFENANLVLMYGINRHLAPRVLAAPGWACPRTSSTTSGSTCTWTPTTAPSGLSTCSSRSLSGRRRRCARSAWARWCASGSPTRTTTGCGSR
jgi:hypothetical protein